MDLQKVLSSNIVRRGRDVAVGACKSEGGYIEQSVAVYFLQNQLSCQASYQPKLEWQLHFSELSIFLIVCLSFRIARMGQQCLCCLSFLFLLFLILCGFLCFFLS